MFRHEPRLAGHATGHPRSGPDLKFPHHENEIAQSEGAFGEQLASVGCIAARCWLTKTRCQSLGNFSTIREIVGVPNSIAPDRADYTVNPREAEMLRFFIVRNHYRSPQNYSSDNLLDAQNALDRLYHTLANVPPAANGAIDWEHPQAQAFRDAMNDDFNTAGAVAALFELATQANRDNDGQASALMRALGDILGLLQTDPATYLRSPSRYQRGAVAAEATLSNEQVDAYVQERCAAKAERNFARADEIRDMLNQHGIELEDKAGGVTQWRRR